MDKKTFTSLDELDVPRLPYKVIVESGVHGVQRMRLIWLKEHYPQQTREMMVNNELEQHLKDTERRFRETKARIMDELMEQRHLLTRSDVMEAHPEITDQDRYFGMKQCEADAERMAIEQVVESF
ncbi:TnpV protein [Bifidobacterium aerophilum]|uniref:TnpV protein n=1 Tax=Bifidobacterium aerophilum TaxID=1798155 RepID=A0A6N9Z5R9_9BIFI|nr:TnpV protein [Bifidobacterium aerophilum]NEG89841.1 TnpV protein [Bifidobacterium aerophilum]